MNEAIALTVSIILGAFAIIAGVIEFFERMGLPTPLENKRVERTKKVILSTLEETGLRPFKLEYEQLSDLLQLKKRIPLTYSEKALDGLIRKYTEFIDNKPVGVYEQTQLSYYIDLMEALSNPDDLRMLSHIMCCQIMNAASDFSGTNFHFDRIAGLKSGNPALALLVSIELQKPCIFVDITGAAYAADPIDGDLKSDEDVVIVHDVIASGQVVLTCANELTKRNAHVKHVFVFVERTDREQVSLITPGDLLRKSGLNVHSLRRLDDVKLQKMMSKPMPKVNL